MDLSRYLSRYLICNFSVFMRIMAYMYLVLLPFVGLLLVHCMPCGPVT